MVSINSISENYLSYYKRFNDSIERHFDKRQIALIGNAFTHNGLCVGRLHEPLPEFSYTKLIRAFPKHKEHIKQLELCLDNPFEAYNKLKDYLHK